MTPSSPPQDFQKYREQGAYHWARTVGVARLRTSLVEAARYEAVRGAIAGHVLEHDMGLDVGSGDGVFLSKRFSGNLRLVGLDGDLIGLRLARDCLEQQTRDSRPALLVAGDALAPPFKNGALSFVTGIEVIEHIYDAPKFLREVRRILSVDGVLCLTTPNASRLTTEIDPYHEHEYTADELQSLLSSTFSDVYVGYQFPNFLLKTYWGFFNSRVLNAVVRLPFRILYACGFNVFARSSTHPRRRRSHGLFAVAK